MEKKWSFKSTSHYHSNRPFPLFKINAEECQQPGPEVDEAWEKYEIIRSHVLTKDEVIKLGKDPSIVAKFDNDYWGFGGDAYMAQMDIFHQIHCLNMLRKAAFQDYQPNYEPEARSKMYWIHLHHCVDISLQNIMCTGTTDLLTLNWMEEYSRPWPDFSVYHQCRDFDTLEEWQHLRGVGKLAWLQNPKT